MKGSTLPFFIKFATFYRMRRFFLTLLVMGMAFAGASSALAQDTLLDFSDVEFTESPDTSAEATEYIDVPDDVVFGDGQDLIDSTDERAELAAADGPAAGGGSAQTLWGIFIAGLIGGFAAFLLPCIYRMDTLTVS